MKKLLTLMALAGATTIAVTACGSTTKAFDFTTERVNEYKAEFKDADFTANAHLLADSFKIEEEVVNLREGAINTPVGEYFWTVFQTTTFADWGFDNAAIIDWNQYKSWELTYSKYMFTSYLPTSNKDKDTTKLEKVADPIGNAGEIYLAKVYVDVYFPSTVKQLSMFKKTGEFDVYAWDQPTDGSEAPKSKYPTFDNESKKMYKLN